MTQLNIHAQESVAPVTVFPRRYYFKVGFYMFFGFLAAQLSVIVVLGVPFFLAMAMYALFSSHPTA